MKKNITKNKYFLFFKINLIYIKYNKKLQMNHTNHLKNSTHPI